MRNADSFDFGLSLATVCNDCARDNALDVVYVPADLYSKGRPRQSAEAHAMS